MRGRYRREILELREEVERLASDPGARGTGAFWNDTAQSICRRIEQENPCLFLRWPEILYTMFVHDAPWSAAQAARLRERPDFAQRWQPALREHSLGAPLPSRHLPGTSDNAIHMAHHLCEFESRTGLTLTGFDAVIEFGGGYGCMCRTARQSGFTGEYYILDLPHFSALQRFYLNGIGISARRSPEEGHGAGVLTFTSAQTLLARLTQLEPKTTILFLATWSLSECPLAVREELLPILERSVALLLAYQDSFDGFDNVQFFSTLRASRNESFEWFDSTTNLPERNAYLFARRRAASIP